MEVIKSNPDLHKVEPAVNMVLEVINGLTVDEAKLCLQLAEDIITGQAVAKTVPVMLVFSTRPNGQDIDSISWILSKKSAKAKVD